MFPRTDLVDYGLMVSTCVIKTGIGMDHIAIGTNESTTKTDKSGRKLKRAAPGYRLRTVPTIVIAHTFCASPDTRISYRRCLLTQGYFCAV